MPHKGKCNFTPRIGLHPVEDGLGSSVKRFKDWHETMLNHTNVYTKQCYEQMSQLPIKIVAIGTKNFVLKLILYGGYHSPNFLNFMYSTHT
jgi:hypothetical protein